MRSKIDTKDVWKVLEENGFVFVRWGKGDHKIYKRGQETLCISANPCYISTFRIIRQYGLRADWFLKKCRGGKK